MFISSGDSNIKIDTNALVKDSNVIPISKCYSICRRTKEVLQD